MSGYVGWFGWGYVGNQVGGFEVGVWQVQCIQFYFGIGFDYVLQYLLCVYVVWFEFGVFFVYYGYVVCGVVQQYVYCGFLFQCLVGEYQVCVLCYGVVVVDVDEQFFGLCCVRQQQGGGVQGDQFFYV